MKLSERHRLRADRAGFTDGVILPCEPLRDYRKELWVAVAAATAGASNCVNDTSPGRFADKALAAFDKTFGGS